MITYNATMTDEQKRAHLLKCINPSKLDRLVEQQYKLLNEINDSIEEYKETINNPEHLALQKCRWNKNSFDVIPIWEVNRYKELVEKMDLACDEQTPLAVLKMQLELGTAAGEYERTKYEYYVVIIKYELADMDDVQRKSAFIQFFKNLFGSKN